MTVEVGYERVRIGPRHPVRWWVYLFVEGAQARNQVARRGVVDHGFRFARGGFATDEDEAREMIQDAREQAAHEIRYWNHQPSHALGPNGELIPLGEVVLQIDAG